MTTIITIKKNKPAYRALILLAKELKKSDESSIIIEEEGEEKQYELTEPSILNEDTEFYLNQLTDFPSLNEIRKKAWPGI
ncbi:MAG: hypothetical protein RBS53_12720 [Bacteroidales bacterium]|jgi:hypothetical protein|nr:hypothetical protein [Bacteroidales bacterium]